MLKLGRSRRSTNRQTVGILVAAVSVIGAAIMVTLAFREDLNLSMIGIGDGGSKGYRNVTLTDAQLTCQEEARSKYGKRLEYLSVDGHSSRFEEKDNRFKIFFNMNLYPRLKRQGERADEYYVNCYVHGSRGNVTHFEAMEKRKAKVSPLKKKQESLFGF